MTPPWSACPGSWTPPLAVRAAQLPHVRLPRLAAYGLCVCGRWLKLTKRSDQLARHAPPRSPQEPPR
jgi:hypothetical protein